MSEALLTNVRFHRLLLAYDTDLARRARTGRCARCGGALHSARYRRKPRGLPAGLGEEYRQRKTAASLRFLDLKVYAAAIVVLVYYQGLLIGSRPFHNNWHDAARVCRT